MPHFSDWVRSGRLDKRWTQADLAGQLSVATSTVCRWERGRAQPRFRARLALADLFGSRAPAAAGRCVDPGAGQTERLTEAAVRISRALETLAIPLGALGAPAARREVAGRGANRRATAADLR